MANTHGAADLGHNGKPSFEALSAQDRAKLADMAAREGVEANAPKPVEAMFLVVIPEGGTAVAFPDITQAAGFTGRPATVAEMAAACHYVQQRIHDSMLANAVVTTQMQAAAAMQQQQENARLRANLKL